MAADTSEIGSSIGTFSGSSTVFNVSAAGYYHLRLTVVGTGNVTIESDLYTCPYSSPFTDPNNFYLGCEIPPAPPPTAS